MYLQHKRYNYYVHTTPCKEQVANSGGMYRASEFIEFAPTKAVQFFALRLEAYLAADIKNVLFCFVLFSREKEREKEREMEELDR